ncbi:MAG: hypothetical protein HN337_00035, partial [Deltaproteobacteria bacterium]|nr:hypothetical protein [Deltaproteobacteria bacterium]
VGEQRVGVVHAKTEGGPRVELDNAIREVHMVSPSIMQVVLSGGDGEVWQDGNWSVRRSDDSEIDVLGVYRHSIPVGAPEYEVGYALPYSDEIIDVDHRIYLILRENVGEKDILQIAGPGGVNMLLPFSDRYLETPVVQLNQVGYNPRSTKRYAYISGWLGDGGALNLDDFSNSVDILLEPSDMLHQKEAITEDLPVTLRSILDDDAGSEVKQVDLSDLPTSEDSRFRIRIPGVGVSLATEISERSALRAFYVVARGLFFNRWGGELRSDLTSWSRPADHSQVITAEMYDPDDYLDKYFDDPGEPFPVGDTPLAGGYHDAGDFDQRPSHTVIAQLLLRAFELHPELFNDGQLNIPESGNGIPDILDEALWGIAGWEALQEPDGGVRYGVQSFRHPWGYYLASDDPLPYWTFSRCPQVSARVAGLFAQASRLIDPYDAARSLELQQKAIDAYNYAKANGANPNFLMYGASELYRLTSEEEYKIDFEDAWGAMGTYGVFNNLALSHLFLRDYDLDGRRAMPDYVLGYHDSELPDQDIIEMMHSWLPMYAGNVLENIENEHAHRNPRPSGYAMTWGQGTTTARYLDTIVASLQIGAGTLSELEWKDLKQEYFNAISLSADYALGGNPNGLVYFTGLGSRNVKEPLHLDSLAFVKMDIGRPMPGIPVYGPVDDIGGAYYS